MIELLSPAGSMEALRAAVQNGANAVYLGYDAFNARMGARNFSVDELQEAIVYCHVRGVQVHLTSLLRHTGHRCSSCIRDVPEHIRWCLLHTPYGPT